MAYCALATFGTVEMLDRLPAVRTGIQLLGIGLFLAVGVWLLVARAAPAPAGTGATTPERWSIEPRRSRWGFAAGFVVGVLNPQYLFSWSAIVAIGVSVAGLRPSLLDRVVFPGAAAAGVTLGYVLLVPFLRRNSAQMAGPGVQKLLRMLGAMLVALALWNVFRLVSR